MPKTKSGELIPYQIGGSAEADARLSAPKDPTIADVTEAMGILNDEGPQDPYDAEHSRQVLKNATPEQKAEARKDLNIPDGLNMGGVVVDELGYMHGGLGFTHRGPIKYSKGGAVKGKTFRGSY
jgi:hypothetical protein